MVLKPDAVFAWEASAETLREIKLPGLIQITVPSGTDEERVADRLSYWKLVGDASGQADRADALTKRYFKKKEALQASLSAARTKTRVAILNGYQGLGLLLGKGNYLDYDLDFVGAENAASTFRPSGIVDMEQLLLGVCPRISLRSAEYS